MPFIVCILFILYIPFMYSIDIFALSVNKNGEICRMGKMDIELYY